MNEDQPKPPPKTFGGRWQEGYPNFLANNQKVEISRSDLDQLTASIFALQGAVYTLTAALAMNQQNNIAGAIDQVRKANAECNTSSELLHGFMNRITGASKQNG
jgi:hypothetical protein